MKRTALLVALLLAPYILIAAPAAPAQPTINIVASTWKFTPGTIRLHVGEAQQLRFTSTSGVHGVQSDALGIPLTTILPGKFVTVTVTPKKTGTYILHCAIPCGTGHANMTLTVRVES